MVLLACAVQLLSAVVRHARYALNNSSLLGVDESLRRQARALTHTEWTAAEEELARADTKPLPKMADAAFFLNLSDKAANYKRLQTAGDEYGLMYHLRAELMRRQGGGSGYNRDGSTWLRKNRVMPRRTIPSESNA